MLFLSYFYKVDSYAEAVSPVRYIAIFAFVGIIFGQTPAQGRAVRIWSIDELIQAADLVVVVEPIKNEDNSEKDIEYYDPKWFQGVSTTFQIKGCFKGVPNEGEIVVKHFKYREGTEGALANGPEFVFFVIGPLKYKQSILDKDNKEGDGIIHSQAARHWLAFLKKAPDGSFVPTTGQYDAALSFKEVLDTSFHQ